MARRRYRKSHQAVESHIREEESPWHSLFHPTIRHLVKSSRSIAHSDDFEGHKLIQTNSRQLFLLDLKILYWCPASRDHVKPLVVHIGTASNFLQCKWVSCSKSYWQGYDLAWYKDMEAPCFPQPNLWLARCASSKQAASKQQASSRQASQPASQPAISITKSCDDAKLELFPGARPPDTTFRNWYDLNRALVWSSKNPTEIHGFDPQKPLKRFNKSLQIS